MTEKLTNTLLQMRLKKKITQQELADSVGVTRQTIIAMEKGNYTPSVTLALKISRFFKKNVEKMFILKK